MAVIHGDTRGGLVEVATKLQIQVQQNGATLAPGESISADVASDGKSVAITAVITGGMMLDADGNSVFIAAAAPTPSEFPI
jgi:hypothetical protein